MKKIALFLLVLICFLLSSCAAPVSEAGIDDITDITSSVETPIEPSAESISIVMVGDAWKEE